MRKKRLLYILPLLALISAALFIGYRQQRIKRVALSKKPIEVFAVQKNKPTGPFRIPILMYHYVEHVKDRKDTIRISLNILPETFESQIKTLIENHYTFLTVADVGKILDSKLNLPEKPIVFTFDDAYADFYTDVYPILKKYHVRATQYVPTEFLNRPNYMTSNQIIELANDQLIEIAAHTQHHIWLKNLTDSRAYPEIVNSKITLERLTGKPIVSFAYPYGVYGPQTAELVKRAGFTTAVATVEGLTQGQQNRYSLFRIRPGGRTGEVLINYLNGLK